MGGMRESAAASIRLLKKPAASDPDHGPVGNCGGSFLQTDQEGHAMIPVVTLYCIADEAGFRLLRGKGSKVEELVHANAKAFDDVHHDFSKGGRNRAGAGATSFGHDTTTAAEIERPRLARHVVAALQSEWSKGAFDRIVLAAGPKMLGALRDAMPKDLAHKIVAEVDKDLSDIPAQDLFRHLDGLG
jgi:protein required for attachment to host cells